MSVCRLLDGKKIAESLLRSIRRDLSGLRTTRGPWPLSLATLRTGDSSDVILYERRLEKFMIKAGIGHVSSHLPRNASEKTIISQIHRFNRDPKITGIMVFSPLPKFVDPEAVFDQIDTLKDVEGRTFLKSHRGVFSPTANAVVALVDAAHNHLAGKEATVIGHSDLVGKPTAVLLMDRMATVVVCHKETRDLKAHVRRADILVTAAGKANLVPGAWIKKGAIVIDVGENMLKGKLVGDVDFETAKKRAGYLTPVPGGVGPVTNVMLLKNLLRLFRLQRARRGDR